MAVNEEVYKRIIDELGNKITLVAVSKTKPIEDILGLYRLGHRDFGENYVQELIDKADKLPKDIRWHFIGHLQTNKVKLIVSFVHLIHGADSFKLLKEINKQGEKINKVVNCLLQIHIAQEETKFGLNENELLNKNWDELHELKNSKVVGLMGMASFTEDINKVRAEFRQLKRIYDQLQTKNSKIQTLSMGMSSDYKIAIEEGSNMVRIGSLLFGERNYTR
jgi:pyridoxal phosphate enzyme (YggS family)